MQTGKRTRRWAFVGQEALRLAGLGVPPKAIAAQLGVDWSTITRWMQQGKLPKTGQGRPGRPSRRSPPVRPEALQEMNNPRPWAPAIAADGVWAAAVRATFALDATDDELVTLAAAALAAAKDPTETLAHRLTAATRFAALVKQLNLVVRNQPAVLVPTPAGPPPRPARPLRPLGADPRSGLMAVK